MLPESPMGYPDWSLNGFGVAVGRGRPVSLSEGVARWLLDGRPATVLGPGDDLRGYDGVLVMGDGSSSRTDKAPGHTNPAAVPFDDAVVSALRQGDASALASVDLGQAKQVGAAGAAAWAAVAAQIAEVETAQVDLAIDPFGVLYVVARWSVRWAVPA